VVQVSSTSARSVGTDMVLLREIEEKDTAGFY